MTLRDLSTLATASHLLHRVVPAMWTTVYIMLKLVKTLKGL
jgi:hypothetical protein